MFSQEGLHIAHWTVDPTSPATCLFPFLFIWRHWQSCYNTQWLSRLESLLFVLSSSPHNLVTVGKALDVFVALKPDWIGVLSKLSVQDPHIIWWVWWQLEQRWALKDWICTMDCRYRQVQLKVQQVQAVVLQKKLVGASNKQIMSPELSCVLSNIDCWCRSLMQVVLQVVSPLTLDIVN